MIVTPDNCQALGDGLDHPESVCLGPDGDVYAGGEAGQVYRLDFSGQQHIVGSTGGFLLGIALDGDGAIHASDIKHQALIRVDPDGTTAVRSRGVTDRPFEVPNHGAFDAAGNFYLSESGDYWQQTTGTGFVAVVRPDDTTEMFHAGPFKFANGVAIHPTGEWLYVAQSTAANIVRIPLDRPNGPVEITHILPSGTVPDGMTFAADGTLVIGCYKPDAVMVARPDGSVETIFEDPTGELLSRPTNVAIGDGKLYISNVGGWHITVVDTDMEPAPIYRPSLK